MGDKQRIRYVSWRGKTWRALAGTPVQSAVSGDVYPYGLTRVGGNNPLYRRLINMGLNATNAMTVNVSNAEADDLNCLVYKRQSADPNAKEFHVLGTFGHEGVFLNVNTPLPITAHVGSSSMDKACAIAVQALHRQITKRRRAVMGGVVAGEMKKTLAMVLRPAKGLRSAVSRYTLNLSRKLGKLGPRPPPSVRKLIADSWLEVTFGWKPLLSDVKDGAIALARVATKNALERQQFRAYGEDVVPNLTTVQTATVAFDAASTVVYDVNRIRSHSSVCIIYGRFSTKLQDSDGSRSAALRLADLSGLTTWRDAIPQAWELAPWSFLTDYFSNVGSVLEGFANLYHGIQWAAEVHIIETKDLKYLTFNVPFQVQNYGLAYHSHFAPNCTSQSSYKSVSRAPWLLSELFPTLRFSVPVGSMQWLNIAALAAGGKSFQPFSSR